jgi:hypothetical protein
LGGPHQPDSGWPKEDPECQDGTNNDLGPGIDFDGGLSVRMTFVPEPAPGPPGLAALAAIIAVLRKGRRGSGGGEKR